MKNHFFRVIPLMLLGFVVASWPGSAQELAKKFSSDEFCYAMAAKADKVKEHELEGMRLGKDFILKSIVLDCHHRRIDFMAQTKMDFKSFDKKPLNDLFCTDVAGQESLYHQAVHNKWALRARVTFPDKQKADVWLCRI